MAETFNQAPIQQRLKNIVKDSTLFIASIPFGCWTGKVTDNEAYYEVPATIHTHGFRGKSLQENHVLVVFDHPHQGRRYSRILPADSSDIEYGTEYKEGETTLGYRIHRHPPYPENHISSGCHDDLIGGRGRRLR